MQQTSAKPTTGALAADRGVRRTKRRDQTVRSGCDLVETQGRLLAVVPPGEAVRRLMPIATRS